MIIDALIDVVFWILHELTRFAVRRARDRRNLRKL